MSRSAGHLFPMPIDGTSLEATLRAAFDEAGVRDDPSMTAAAMLQGACSLPCTTPVQTAGAIVRTWETINAWRRDDPRAGARVLALTTKDVTALRAKGLDAMTAFAHSGRPDTAGIGMYVLIGTDGYGRREMTAALDLPDHVLIVMLDDPDRLPSDG